MKRKNAECCGRYGDFERSVRRWVDDNRAGEAFRSHPQVMTLNYEELVSDFENRLREICVFIDEPFDGKLLEFSSESSGVELAAREGAKPSELRGKQIEHGLYNGQGRWEREMTEEQKDRFKEMAGEMLIEYGYAADLNW